MFHKMLWYCVTLAGRDLLIANITCRQHDGWQWSYHARPWGVVPRPQQDAQVSHEEKCLLFSCLSNFVVQQLAIRSQFLARSIISNMSSLYNLLLLRSKTIFPITIKKEIKWKIISVELPLRSSNKIRHETFPIIRPELCWCLKALLGATS